MKKRKYNPMLDSYEYVELPEIDRSDYLMDTLSDAEIDPAVTVRKPDIIFSIQEKGGMQFENKRVFTLGNFSAIIGKAKSKKTFLLSAIAACIISSRLMWSKFQGHAIEGKDIVLYFDTEQGDYDSWNVIKRIAEMAGLSKRERFKAFNLRRFTPLERCELIEQAFIMYGQRAGLVIIDGVADLATGINDEEEATRVVTMLMRLTKDHNCHISIVIHENKNDNFATGHLGSAIMKKSEVIISVTKDPANSYQSKVECKMIRGVADFKPFMLAINAEGIPEIDDQVIEIEDRFENIKDEVPF